MCIVTIDFEGNYESSEKIKKDLDVVLSIFKKHNVNATFFVVGKLLEQYPEEFRSVPKNHEIAIHGYTHKKIDKYTETELREEIINAKNALNRVRSECFGFRAPFNIINGSLSKILLMEGFKYDSSLCRSYFPFRYNYRSIPNNPYMASYDLKNTGNKIMEIPITSYSAFKIPYSISFMKSFYPFVKPGKNIRTNQMVLSMHNYDLTCRNFPKENFFVGAIMGKDKEKGRKIVENIFMQDQQFISCRDYLKKKNVI